MKQKAVSCGPTAAHRLFRVSVLLKRQVMSTINEIVKHDTKGSFMGDHAGWKDLVGRYVQVLKNGRTIRTGYVEDVAVSADVLWIEADGADPRALYEKAQGYTVLPVSKPVR